MAEGDDKDQKTEQPTQARIDQARASGQVPHSRELNHWFLIGTGTLIILAFAPSIAESLTATLTNFIARPEAVADDATSLEALLTETIMKAAFTIVVPLILLMAAAMAGSLVQTGLNFSIDPIMPKFSKLSPIAGFHRIFSVRNLVEFVKNLIKLAIIGSVAFSLLNPTLPGIEHLIALEPVQILGELRHLVLRLCFGVLVTLTIIMIADVIYQRFAFTARLRMTRQEVKQEMRQSEGDPVIKQRLRQLRMQRARQRMMANVPKADVVITNPTHFAIALQYDPLTMTAPLCLAKGQDVIALKIREVAEKNNVALVENKPLARALYATVEIDEQIPAEHYKAVAEVISYVFRLRGRSLNR